MGLTRGVYLSDVEDAILEAERLRRSIDAKTKDPNPCDTVSKLIRASVRYVIKEGKLRELSLEGVQ